MTKTKQNSGSKTILLLIGILAILGISIYHLNTQNTSPLKKDEDCIEWGVEVEYPNHTKAWAHTAYDPRNREEAERIAKQMELEDVMGNRNYTAKCKRYK